MATVMKTPGVYIVEKDAFPNSVVEVETAVPAFIGYTAKADNAGRSLINKPRRITSLIEFEKYYGGPPKLEGQFMLSGEAPAALDGNGDDDDSSTRTMGVRPGPTEPVVIQGQGADQKKYYLARPTESRRFHLYYGLKSFYQNGGGPCYIVSTGTYDQPDKPSANHFETGIAALRKEQEPTMLVFPDAVLLPNAECATVQTTAVAHCADMQSRFAILDVYRGFLARDEEGHRDCVEDFREDVGTKELKYAAAYYPWIETSVVTASETGLDFTVFHTDAVQALTDVLTAELIPEPAATDPKTQAANAKFEALINDIVAPDGETADAKAVRIRQTNDGLMAVSKRFKEIMAEVQRELNRLPPSATMAGVYTSVDNSRGVWKAPANVSLSAVVKPCVNITHEDQQDLNVPTNGKSVNAIRSFIGEGTLVWGARTLDGNSLDWRYIQVRRALIMLEQSVKLASKAYVFENNDANTWITMKSMIRNFLTGIWKRGGLAGASPDDAFSVHVGLGETMTPEDILEGILRITVLVAPIRPAEFIEITFQQQMQKS